MRIFLASSQERGDDLDRVAVWLEDAGQEVVPWTDFDFSKPGEHVFEALTRVAQEVGAGVFVFSPDDKLWYRGKRTGQPRDNVLIEYGLFAAHLGHRNAIICSVGEVKTASDLHGLSVINLDKKQRARAQVKKWAKNLQEGSPTYLKGEWECEWITDHPEEEFDPVTDTVSVLRVRRSIIDAESNTPGFGRCIYRGYEHDFTISLSYQGVGSMKQLVGMVILKKAPGAAELKGNWIQYTRKELIATGRTYWRKKAG